MAKRVRRRRSNVEQLKAKAEKLRLEFAETDLAVAMTFVRLARFYFQVNHPERAMKLLWDARHAAYTVEKIVSRLSGEIAKTFIGKLTALIEAIDEARKYGPT